MGDDLSAGRVKESCFLNLVFYNLMLPLVEPMCILAIMKNKVYQINK